MKLWFTSDTHFDHATALKWRPEFSTVEEMNETLIANWNDRVAPGDLIYHLGDIGFSNDPDRMRSILDRLNGQLHGVLGNHDPQIEKWHKRWGKKSPFVTLRDIRYISGKAAGSPEQKIMLCHYPMVTWRASHAGSWMLHGHCHGNLQWDRLPAARRLDVGVDPMAYRPVSFEEVEAMMIDMRTDWIDHHVPRAEREEFPPCAVCGGGNYMLSAPNEHHPDRFHKKGCPGDGWADPSKFKDD